MVGTWYDNGVRFSVDWRGSPYDPLDPRIADLVAEGWRVGASSSEAIRWRPRPPDVERMVVALGDATDTQTIVATGGPPPQLEVSDLSVPGGELASGISAEISLTVTNRGQGPAYRVAAVLRSSLEPMHGLRFHSASSPRGKARPGPAPSPCRST